MTPDPNPSPEREALATIASALGDFDAAKIDSITVTRRIGNALHMAGAKWDNAQRRYGFDADATIAADRFPFPMTAFYDTAFKDGRDDDYNPDAAIGRHLATPALSHTLPAPGEVVEAPENGEPDAEWRAIRRAIDQFVGRVPVISKHRAVHNTTLAETVARLDAAGDREAADTIVWLCWFRALDRERERFLLADAAEKSATVAAANDEGVRERIAKALADRFIERGNARVAGSVHASWDEMPWSYRNDFLADADAVLASLATSRSQHEGASS